METADRMVRRFFVINVLLRVSAAEVQHDPALGPKLRSALRRTYALTDLGPCRKKAAPGDLRRIELAAGKFHAVDLGETIADRVSEPVQLGGLVEVALYIKERVAHGGEVDALAERRTLELVEHGDT